jgi:hypothetical protein
MARDMAAILTRDAVPTTPRPADEYAKLAVAIVEDQMLNGQCIRSDAGQRFARK